MSKTLKKASFYLRRKSRLPLIVVGSLVVALLVLNDDISISLNIKYDKEIARLEQEIKECKDSAAYYRERRESIQLGKSDLEHLAREQFHMQRPTEDVFIIASGRESVPEIDETAVVTTKNEKE